MIYKGKGPDISYGSRIHGSKSELRIRIRNTVKNFDLYRRRNWRICWSGSCGSQSSTRSTRWPRRRRWGPRWLRAEGTFRAQPREFFEKFWPWSGSATNSVLGIRDILCWSGSGSSDPYHWLMDPDPTPDPTTLFNDFKDLINKKKSHFFLISYHSYIIFSLKN